MRKTILPYECRVTPELFRGVVAVETGEHGLIPSRLPSWARERINDPFMSVTSSQAAGIRMTVTTAADSLSIDYVGTRMVESEEAEVPPSHWDITADGTMIASATGLSQGRAVFTFLDPQNLKIIPGEVSTVRFDGLGSIGEQTIEIWLPYTDSVEVVALRADKPIQVAPISTSEAPRWIHYGSSISHGYCADRTTDTWPVAAATAAGANLTSFGFSGSAMLDGFVARVIRDQPADLISIKAGINIVNGDALRRRIFAPLLHSFLDTVRDGHPSTPIVVASPIWCAPVEEHPGPTYESPNFPFPWQLSKGRREEIQEGKLSLQVIREITEAVVANRNDDSLYYVDGLSLYSGEDSETLPLPDNLHPSSAVHELIGRRWKQKVLDPLLENRGRSEWLKR